ncbi:MAG: PilZ domain-containing protein [Deltaproteobacteria bacterium]|nr:PilZ domain-containing protein [Deltaproteobacteria bacterium]
MSKERRKQTRVQFETEVILKSEKSEIRSNVNSKDISLKGMYVRTREKMPVGTYCDIRIILTGSTDNLFISLKGRIIRQDAFGLGIHFDSVDLDSFQHLKNLLMYNAPDPDAIEKEIVPS